VHPVLFRIGDLAVTSYGLALSLGFAVGIAVAYRRAAGHGLDGERILDVSILIIVAALLGSRAFYVAAHPEAFRPPQGQWTDVFNPFREGGVGISGLSVMGGLPVALLATAAYLRWKRLPIGAYLDLLAPSVALGAGITRIGCLLNGCCFGVPSALPIAIRFPEGSLPAAVFEGQSLHPTQLYQSLAGFAICAGLIWLDRRRPFEGAVVLALCIAMGLQRAAVELVRYNEAPSLWLRIGPVAVSTYQLVALALLAVGAGLWWRLRIRSAQSAPPLH